MKNKFKIGDRVTHNSLGKGYIAKKDGDDSVLVVFDNQDDRLHDGDMGSVFEKRCWWCNPEEDLILENEVVLSFIGDVTKLNINGKEYTAKCHKDDDFNEEFGVLMCIAKSAGYSYEDIQKMVKKAKRMITLVDFFKQKDRTVIQCDTEEKANKLMIEFNKLGKKWCTGDSYTVNDNQWNVYRTKTCYSNKGSYADLDCYKSINDVIYEFDDIILPKHDFKVGDRVQFKAWEEMEKEFGVDCSGDIKNDFVASMKHLCGTYATVETIGLNGNIKLNDFSAKGDTQWVYSTDMIKPAKKKPEWTFTEDEKVILRNLPEEYKWIARDRDGDLMVYEVKPEKRSICWGGRMTDFEMFCVFNHLFRSIKWEDEEPCEFRKYI